MWQPANEGRNHKIDGNLGMTQELQYESITDSATAVTLHADPEHEALRFVVLMIVTVALILSYLAISALIRAAAVPGLLDSLVPLSCAGAFPLAMGISWLAEQRLKQVWHSGRRITLHEQGIEASDGEEQSVSLTWADNLTYLNWYFKLSGYKRGGRERRVASNWVCLACQLQQDEQRVIVYSYMPPKQADLWIHGALHGFRFAPIMPAVLYDHSLSTRLGPPVRPRVPASILGGKDGHYWLAEQRRWYEGFELTPADFATLMQAVAMQTRV